MSNHKDFAKIERATNGQQVLFYYEHDSEEEISVFHCIAHFDGFSVDQQMIGVRSEKLTDVLAMANPKMADEFVRMATEVFGSLK